MYWGVYFVVPLVYILSVILPDSVGVVLTPIGVFVAAIAFIVDIISKKLFTKVQMFKLFCDSLLVVKFAQLYEYEVVVTVASVVAVLSAFVLVIFFAYMMNEIAEEVREIGSDE